MLTRETRPGGNERRREREVPKSETAKVSVIASRCRRAGKALRSASKIWRHTRRRANAFDERRSAFKV